MNPPPVGVEALPLPGATDLARAAGQAGPSRRAAAARPGVRGLHRLRRPGELRHQHRRRRQVRVPAAVGRPRGEPDGDADPVPVGQARRRDRCQPARDVPRAVRQPCVVGAVGAGGADRDGDRPGRVCRRGDRAEPAVRDAPVRRRPGHGRRRVRDPRPPERRLTAASRARSSRCWASSSPGSSTTRCGSASTPARRRRASSHTSTAPARWCSPPASSARPSCRTSSTCTRR